MSAKSVDRRGVRRAVTEAARRKQIVAAAFHMALHDGGRERLAEVDDGDSVAIGNREPLVDLVDRHSRRA